MKSGKPSHRRKKRWCGGFFSSLGEIFELLILYQKAKLRTDHKNLMTLFISFAEGIFYLAKRKYSSQTKLRPRQTKLALVKRN